jgi:hypothetical protein
MFAPEVPVVDGSVLGAAVPQPTRTVARSPATTMLGIEREG